MTAHDDILVRLFCAGDIGDHVVKRNRTFAEVVADVEFEFDLFSRFNLLFDVFELFFQNRDSRDGGQLVHFDFVAATCQDPSIAGAGNQPGWFARFDRVRELLTLFAV